MILSNQSGFDFSSALTLTGGMISKNSELVSFNLSAPDLNRIKLISNLCVDVNSCYIQLNDNTISDMNSNQLTPISLQLFSFTPDTTKPRLISFSLNLNFSILSLSFSETVNVSSFIISGIVIGDSSQLFQHRLSSSYPLGNNSPFQEIQLSSYDVNSIKENDNFATSRLNTFLSVEGYLIADMSGNLVEPALSTSRLVCLTFIPDFVPPTLISSHLNMDAGTLQLTFSEPVVASSFRPNEFVIRNNITFYRLTGGYTDDINKTDVNFYLNDFDVNNIKSDLNLASNFNNSYYSYSSQLLTDMNLNGVHTVSNNYLNRFSNFTQDLTPPRLVSFSINLMLETIALTFDEPILPITLNPSQITLLDPDSKISYSLTSSFLLNETISVMQLIQVTSTDINELKSLEIVSPLSLSSGVLIYLTEFFANDTNDNRITSGPIPPIPIICLNQFVEECLNVSSFFTLSLNITTDPFPPSLIRWNLNLTSGEIRLFFSETVVAESIDISKILFQDSSDILDSRISIPFSLTSNTTSSFNNDPEIVLLIGIEDLNDLKAIPTLCTCLIDNCYLSIGYGATTDLFNHTNTVITLLSALNVSTCFPDLISPTLNQFSFYFIGSQSPLILQLLFSETVNSSSFDSTQITFGTQLNFSNDFSSVYSLTASGFTNSLYSDILNFSISDGDLSAIRDLNLFLLGIDTNKTFMALTMTTVKDMQNNFILPIFNSSSLMVRIDNLLICNEYIVSIYSLFMVLVLIVLTGNSNHRVRIFWALGPFEGFQFKSH